MIAHEPDELDGRIEGQEGVLDIGLAESLDLISLV